MHDELTQIDIMKMKQELEHRIQVMRPAILEEVKRTRAFGDLSENEEYKLAKREKNANDRRIRYLEGMIKTAVVITDESKDDEVGMFDRITIYIPEDDEEQVVRIVTTVRLDVLDGRISRESPLGGALLGHRAGDEVFVALPGGDGYKVIVRAIEKADDDPSIPLNKF